MSKTKNPSFEEKWQTLLKILTTADSERNRTVAKQDYEPFIKIFAEYCPPKEYGKIIDLGMGNGIELIALAEMGYQEILGINYNESMDSINEEKIYHCPQREHISWLSFLDMHQLSSIKQIKNTGSYDAIFCLQTLEHALAPFMVIMEMRKVLRDNGRVYLDLPDPHDEAMLTTLQHTSVLHETQWISLFIKAGFVLLKNLSVKHRLGFVFEKIPDIIFYATFPGLRNYYSDDYIVREGSVPVYFKKANGELSDIEKEFVELIDADSELDEDFHDNPLDEML